MSMVESAALTGFVGVVRGFLSGSKNDNYKELVENMLTSFHSLGARMSVKAHFLFSHKEKFLRIQLTFPKSRVRDFIRIKFKEERY